MPTAWTNFLAGGPGDPAAIGIDSDDVIDEALPTLHAATRGDLVFWDVTELIEWLDEGLKRLAAGTAFFVSRATASTVIGQAGYDAPPQHLATLHVSLDNVPLRAGSTIELEARDSSYLTTPGTPDHWYEDLQGLDHTSLTPVPAAVQTMASIFTCWPGTLDDAEVNHTIPAPNPLKGYLAMWLIGEAYGREGQMEAPEIAAHCEGRIALYQQLFQAYYGHGL